MTQPIPEGRRRIDRVLGDAFLADLPAKTLDELRTLRHEAEQEEADLSYLRRLLQGRLDLVRAEQASRGEGGEPAVLDRLTEVLTDPVRSTRGSGRFLTVEPSRVAEHRRAIEQVLADVGLSDLSAQSDDQLQRSHEVLSAYEQEVSLLRGRVQEVMDACTGEIARRYRDGEADVQALLRP